MTAVLLQYRGGGHYTAPYDSTQGVPGIIFLIFWIIIIAFLIRLAWEYRDKIFKPKDLPGKRKSVTPRKR